MSGFSLQSGQIRAALVAAGLPASAAAKIALILGNTRQEMSHSGELVHDRTPESMGYVTPSARKHSLTGVDFRAGDPDFRATRAAGSEQGVRPVQENSVLQSRSPQQSSGSFRVQGGKFTDATGTGDAVKVNLRVNGGGRIAVLDSQTNSIVGKNIRCESSGDYRFFVEESESEVVLKLQPGSGGGGSSDGGVSVIVNAEWNGESLVFARALLRGVTAEPQDPIIISTSACST